MTVSDFIKELQKIEKQYGNYEIYCWTFNGQEHIHNPIIRIYENNPTEVIIDGK